MAEEGGVKRDLEEAAVDDAPAAKRVKASDPAEEEAAGNAVEAADAVKDYPAGGESYLPDELRQTRLQTG
jgi:hypothetical protein